MNTVNMMSFGQVAEGTYTFELNDQKLTVFKTENGFVCTDGYEFSKNVNTLLEARKVAEEYLSQFRSE